MEPAIESLEKGAADKKNVNKSTIVSLEKKCDTLADRVKEVNASTKSDIKREGRGTQELKGRVGC